jgi:hypothetical protein
MGRLLIQARVKVPAVERLHNGLKRTFQPGIFLLAEQRLCPKGPSKLGNALHGLAVGRPFDLSFAHLPHQLKGLAQFPQPSLVDRVAFQDVIAQHIGGPDTKLGVATN